MINRMREPPNRKPTWESYFGKRRPPSALRLFKRQFALERKHTERLFNGLHRALHAEIGYLERRITDKFEEIDVSLNLIAIELGRHGENQPPSDTGS